MKRRVLYGKKFGRFFVGLMRSRDNQWSVDGIVKRLHLKFGKGKNAYLISFIVFAFVVQIGWELQKDHDNE